ncbi:MAG: ABC transporter permease [Acidimicrobiia bacterium]
MNPVTRRELQERFRTLRSPILLSVWVLAAGALTFLAYVVAQSAAENQLGSFGGAGLSSVFASGAMGRFMLHTILIGLLTAMVFVVPGQAAVAIVGEKERQTLPLLQASQLSAWRIVLGKLASALAYIMLLLVATTPLLVIPVLLGGVTIVNVISGIAMVAAAAVMIGAVSIWVSARARSVQGAVLGSYVWTVAIVFGTLALLVAEVFLLAPDNLGPTRFENGFPRDDGRELYAAHLNPYMGLVDASSNPIDFRSELVTSPYVPFRLVLAKRQGFAAGAVTDYTGVIQFGGGGFEDDVFFERELSAVPGFVTDGGSRVASPTRIPVWPTTLAFQLGLAALALTSAARRVRVPGKRRRVRLRRVHAS